MQAKLRFTICLLVFWTAGCGITGEAASAERAEAIRLCQNLRNIEANSSDTAIAKTLADVSKWAGNIQAMGIYPADKPVQMNNAEALSNKMYAFEGHLQGAVTILKDLKLKNAYPQIQRDAVVKVLEERSQRIDKLASLLTALGSQIRVAQPQGLYAPAAAPRAISEIRALISSAPEPKPVVADALKELRTKYNIRTEEMP